MSDATKGIADCNKRYPRKNKDAVARDNCVKPFNAVLKSSAGALPNGDAPKFNSEDAGKLKIWQSVADTMNEAWQPDVKIIWERAAFYCMTAIMALFVLVKNFLWAAYSREMAIKHDAENGQSVTVPEHALGDAATVAESATTEATSPQPEKQPFGFAGGKSPAASSADRNRAKLQTVENSQVHDRNTGYRYTGNDRVRDTVDGKPYTGNDCNTGIRYTGIEAVKAAKVGQVINCPVCGESFTKANKWHLFCSNSRKKKADGTSCADTYYNAENPDRLRAIKRK
jgi:pyruvate/2-oxoglutarate dehydrogenase complex dihydrolipoamide acyltransferase (E2) component